MRFLIKCLVMLAMFGLGAVFLLNGIGTDIALIKFRGFEASGVPAGLALVAGGVALAYLWDTSSTTTKTQIRRPDGSIVTIFEKIRKGLQ